MSTNISTNPQKLTPTKVNNTTVYCIYNQNDYTVILLKVVLNTVTIALLHRISVFCFQVLLKFLNKIVSCRDKNLMGLNNVAMIIAPNLFLSPMSRAKPKSINDAEIMMAAGTSNVVRMLIKYQKIIWMVSLSNFMYL